MKVELTIDRTKELPEGAVPALEELLKRLQSQFDECSLIVRRAGSDGLSVYGGEKEAKKRLRKSSSRPGKVQTTGFIETACRNFPVGGEIGETKRRITEQGLCGHQVQRWGYRCATALIS
jgi:hypothetical protein